MNENETELVTEVESSEKEALYTASEVAEMISSERGKAIDGAERKWKRELKAKLDEERERAVTEICESKNRELDELKRQLEESERSRIMRERELECAKALGEMKLPMSLSRFAVDYDSDAMADKLSLIKDAFSEAVSREVSERIGTMRPIEGKSAPLSREALKKMTLAELQNIYGSTKTLY